MGSVSVSSCRCMFVSRVHPVAVLNAEFCMTCSLLMLVEDAIGDHTEEAYSRAGLTTASQVAMSVSLCLPHPVAVSAFMICRGLCACTEMLWMCMLYVSFESKERPRTLGYVAMGSASSGVHPCLGSVSSIEMHVTLKYDKYRNQYQQFINKGLNDSSTIDQLEDRYNKFVSILTTSAENTLPKVEK